MATWVATDLKRAGYQVWFDQWKIEGGYDIIDEIGNGIEMADALVMLVSKSYIDSAMCKTEWHSYWYTKDNPRLRRGNKRAYSYGRIRQEKNSLLK